MPDEITTAESKVEPAVTLATALEPKARVEGAPAAEVKPVAKDAVAAPQAKTYTEQEIASIKAGHDGTVKKMREDLKAANAKLLEWQQAQEAKETENLLKAATEQGANPDVVKSILERDKSNRTLAAQLAQQRAALEENAALLNEAGRNKMALDLAKTYGLDDKEAAELTKATDDVGMENTALKLAIKKSKQAATPPENPDNAAKAAPKGIDLKSLPTLTKLGMALEGKL